MIKFNISNIITRAETIGKNCSLNKNKKTAVKKIKTTKKIFTAKQDDKQNKTITKMLISKVDFIKTNLVAQTKKTTDLTNRISQVRQLNDFYSTNFNRLSTDMKYQLKEAQKLANNISGTGLEATKEQEDNFNKAFSQLMKYNNTQMKILKPYMSEKYTILQNIDKKITKQIKNKSQAESISKLIEDRDLLRKQYNSYKETVNMLKNSKTYKKSLDDDVKQLDSKIKKSNNKFSSLYNTQTNKNNSLMPNIDDTTSERNKLNNAIFEMTNIELKTPE